MIPSLDISQIDAAILLVYVGVALALGVWFGRGSNTLSGFLVGGRNLPWFAVLGSIIATETSAVTFLSIPGITYAADGDFRFLQLALGFILGRLLVVVWLLPNYFKGEVFTAYDVLHRRFGGLTQRTASGIFLVTRTIADGLRLYLTGLVLREVTGVDVSFCIAAIGVTTVVYASLGGIKGVVWNDCFQLIVYLLGAIVAILVISRALPDGMQGIVQLGRGTGRFEWISSDFSLQSANLWSGIIGGSFIALASHGTDQMMVQRLLCARSQRAAAWALGLSGPLVFLQFALFLFVGVALAAFYGAGGDALVGSLDRDEVFAGFIVDSMPIGLCGLTLAAVFSVAMSTLSSSLSSSASAVVNDFLRPRLERQLVAGDPDQQQAIDRRLTRASRLWTALFGGCQVLVGVLVVSTPSLAGRSAVHQVITVAALTSGLILGVFLLGLTQRRFAERSILIGMLTGFGATLVLILTPADASWHVPTWLPAGVSRLVLTITPDTATWHVHAWWAAVVASLSTCTIVWIVDLLFPAPAVKSPPAIPPSSSS